MSSNVVPFRSPPWLRGRHWQTIYAAQLAPRARVNYRRERWQTPDGDFIDIDFSDPAGNNAPGTPHTIPLLVLFHGLEGCSRSHYALALMAAAGRRGWRGAVVHFRGCSGELNRAPRAYHSGDSDEIDWVLQRMASRYPGAHRYAAGVSLGGNALLKWAGLHGHQATRHVRRIATLCAPHDLQAGALALSAGFSRLYTWNFMRTLKVKSRAKLAQFPGLFDRDNMERARTFYEFDNAVTAPMHGFAGSEDYWTQSSCRQYMAGIHVPALVVNALNDPFVPPASLARPDQVSGSVTLAYPKEGGHVGFVSGRPPGSLHWISENLLDWFEMDNVS